MGEEPKELSALEAITQKMDGPCPRMYNVKKLVQLSFVIKMRIEPIRNPWMINKTTIRRVIIPYVVLESESMVSFFDRLLGTKYNSLLKKCQHQTTEASILQAVCEDLSNQCIQECEPESEALKKYTPECLEREHLYNQIIELKGNIICRCRPLSSEDMLKYHTLVVEFDQSQDPGLSVVCSDHSKKQFRFDHVFSKKVDKVFHNIAVAECFRDGCSDPSSCLCL